MVLGWKVNIDVNMGKSQPATPFLLDIQIFTISLLIDVIVDQTLLWAF